MTVAPSDESSLPAAVDELYRRVSDLVDARKEMVAGALRAGPSLYEALVGLIPAAPGDHGGRSVGRSLPPVWLDAVDVRADIDRRVRSWQPAGVSTPARLRAVASRRWRPQDTRQVADYAAEIGSWCVSVRGLLDPHHVKTVAAACPACGARWVYRPSAGETVRQPALQIVAELGCTCLKCRTHWAPDRYLFLVRLLGFDLPAGVLE